MEFYKNQIEQAKCVVLSHTSNIDDTKLQYCLDTVKSLNKDAVIVTTPWDEIDGEKIFAAMTNVSSLANDLQHLHEEEVCPVCGGHHHHHDEDEECSCGHHHHHGHDADEVFSSWGVETAGKYGAEQIKELLSSLDSGEYGVILRAKGIVPSADGKWIHFDYVPEEVDVRFGSSEVIGRICVIGSKIDEGKLAKLFEI